MPMPVRSLPTVQNWDCHQCGDCCRTYAVRVTAEEKDRILKQGWMADPEFKGKEPLKLDKATGEYSLGQTADGTCVFLGEKNLCRIHAKFGAAAKPFACRLYPFILVPSGDHWKVSLRFACPSVADNKGRACTAHASELTSLTGPIEADNPKAVNLEPPELQAGQTVPWGDLTRFTKAFLKVLTDTSHPIERRLRQVAMLAGLCRQSRFDTVSGGRLDEFLNIVAAAAIEEVPTDPNMVPRPGWVGRTLFRQQVGVYLRADIGPHAGVGKRGAWARFAAGWRFGVGGGAVPQVNEWLPKGVPFSAAEQPAGELPKAADELFTRYFAVKVESGQFYGPSNFHRGYWDGLDSLLLVFPTMLWAARVMTTGGTPRIEAISKGLRMVDENFGYSRALGDARTLWGIRTMADRGEIARLIAWYAR